MKWLTGMAIILLVSAVPASAARPSLHITPAAVAPGGKVRVFGNADGCPRGDVVTIISPAFPGHGFAGVGAIKARVKAGGAFSAQGRVRRHAKPGRYGVTARCGGGNLGVAAFLRVT